jgi:glyoxylase I family protein
MKLEHLAFFAADPIAVGRWYVEQLGMKLVRASDQPPYTRFLADSSGMMLIEVCGGSLEAPDYRAMDPLMLHLALAVEDVTAERARLIAAGASPVGEIGATASGDQIAMLRDPWGLAVQLVRRKAPMLATEPA